MITNEHQLQVSLLQLQRLLNALEALREDVLPRDPRLFGVMAEAPLDDIERVRQEIDAYLEAKLATAPAS